MPFPALIAGIARVGASLFASQAARTAAAGAARVAAGATESAAAGAATAPVTQASRVLTGAPGNAKQITMMLRGGTPASVQGASPFGASAAAKPPPMPGAAPTPPPIPNAPPPMPSGAGQAAKSAAKAGPPPSALERIGKFAEDARGKIQTVRERLDPFNRLRSAPSKSVQDETRDMTLDQRYQRLQQQGSLLGKGEVAKSTGSPNPSLADVVGASEKAEQREREQADKNRAEGEGKGVTAAKTLASGAMSVATLSVTAPFIIAKSIHHLEQWGTSLMESRRDLRRFDGAIANTFARLDRQQVMNTARRAQATSGSTRALGEALGDLRKDIQPLVIAGATTANILMGMALDSARLVLWFTKLTPHIQLFLRVAKLAEDKLGSNNRTEDAYTDFVRRTARGDFARPKNSRPGDGTDAQR